VQKNNKRFTEVKQYCICKTNEKNGAEISIKNHCLKNRAS